MTLENLLSALDYPPDMREAVRKRVCDGKRPIEAIAEIAYQGENLDFPLCRHTPLTQLAVVTCLLVRKYDEYRARGIPDHIIFDTFRDVPLRAGLYFEKTKQIGISKEDTIWFRHIMDINIFKIGTLQFQPFKMLYLDEATLGEPYMTFESGQKDRLPPGAPVINCHIQRGADLRGPSVDSSLEEAKAFFGKHFPSVQFRAFLCYSWLLYPPMIGRLPERSHIRQFADRFMVIGSCHDSEQAIENLYEDTGETLSPHLTCLQKMAADNAELLGFACGMIPISMG